MSENDSLVTIAFRGDAKKQNHKAISTVDSESVARCPTKGVASLGFPQMVGLNHPLWLMSQYESS